MNELNVWNKDGVLVTDSREVSKMVGKRHADLIRDIKGYEKILLNADLRSADFFIHSKYQDANGRTLPCFLLTRKGCDMVANKMTGERGVLFTAAYINRFYEMESLLKSPYPNSDLLPHMAGVASYLRTQRAIMRDNGNTARDISEMSKQTCDQLGITLPASFTAPDCEQLTLFSV